jgi:hypothetical protein
MSANGDSGKLADAIAEEVLRTIYGDDYAGCKVAPSQIASIIAEPIVKVQSGAIELLDLYDKVMEAILLLSTPPGKIDDPQKLGSLLSERLDTIHNVVAKTIETTSKFKSQQIKKVSEQEPE